MYWYNMFAGLSNIDQYEMHISDRDRFNLFLIRSTIQADKYSAKRESRSECKLQYVNYGLKS